MWTALRAQHFPEPYAQALARLYQGQTAQAVSDQSCRTYKLERGTRQGCPLCPALFNAALEHFMRNLKVNVAWRKGRRGVRIGSEYLAHLRFADDILLVGPSRAQLRHMLCDFSDGSRGVRAQAAHGQDEVFVYCGSATRRSTAETNPGGGRLRRRCPLLTVTLSMWEGWSRSLISTTSS